MPAFLHRTPFEQGESEGFVAIGEDCARGTATLDALLGVTPAAAPAAEPAARIAAVGARPREQAETSG